MIYTLYRNPWFITGIIIKIILIYLNNQTLIFESYIQFITFATSHPIFAWSNWYDIYGSDGVFPYGFIMLYIFLPFFYLGEIFQFNPIYSFYFVIFIFDYFTLILLILFFPQKKSLTIYFYWLSPIILFSVYYQGFNDVIPAALLFFSLYLITKKSYKLSGFILGCSVSAKLSMAAVVPFILLYFYRNRNLRKPFVYFLSTFLTVFIISSIPMILSEAHFNMIKNNLVIQNLWQLKFLINNQFYLYIAPMFYLFLFYSVWRIQRINHNLLLIITGIVLISLALFVLAPGWFVWSVSLFVYYLLYSKKTDILLLVFIYNIFYLLIFLKFDFIIFNISSDFLKNIFITIFFSLIIILVYKMWRDGIKLNDFFRSTLKPVTIGIVGNSGVGKDLLVSNIKCLLGNNTTSHISGDDYHRWDRKKPFWKYLTHLNPNANDINLLTNDMINLINGEYILKKQYNHSSGTLSKSTKMKSKDFLITSGLHTLFNSTLRDIIEIKIYISMSDNLRLWFKLNRDIKSRNRSLNDLLSVEKKRKNDFIKFVDPQKNFADIIFVIKCSNYSKKIPLKSKIKPKIILEAVVPSEFNDFELNRLLVGICNIHVEIIHKKLGDRKKLIISGEVTAMISQ